MLNITSEQEYQNKSLRFLKKIYGIGEYKFDHSSFKDMESFVIKDYNEGIKTPHRIVLDFTNSSKRAEIVKYVNKVLKSDDHALVSLEIMFDYHLLPGEKENYSSDYNEVKDLLIAYCQKYNCRAVTVTHFNQYLNSTNPEEGYYCRHIHIIYEQDPEVSFRTFLMSRLI